MQGLKEIQAVKNAQTVFNFAEYIHTQGTIELSRAEDIKRATSAISDQIHRALEKISRDNLTTVEPFVMSMSLNIQISPVSPGRFKYKARILPDLECLSIENRELFIKHFSQILEDDLND